MQAVKEANINLEKVCMKSSLEEKELAARRYTIATYKKGARQKSSSTKNPVYKLDFSKWRCVLHSRGTAYTTFLKNNYVLI